jgi:hypothetical protein
VGEINPNILCGVTRACIEMGERNLHISWR